MGPGDRIPALTRATRAWVQGTVVAQQPRSAGHRALSSCRGASPYFPSPPQQPGNPVEHLPEAGEGGRRLPT